VFMSQPRQATRRHAGRRARLYSAKKNVLVAALYKCDAPGALTETANADRFCEQPRDT